MGYCATSADDLTEALWEHYFALRLGPLAWSPPSATHDPPAPPVAAEAAGEPSTNPHILNLEREWKALEHFETAGTLLADGEYAAAKREVELSLAIDPATSFYDHKRVETLCDVESCQAAIMLPGCTTSTRWPWRWHGRRAGRILSCARSWPGASYD
jgi:hypothetical protein